MRSEVDEFYAWLDQGSKAQAEAMAQAEGEEGEKANKTVKGKAARLRREEEGLLLHYHTKGLS